MESYEIAPVEERDKEVIRTINERCYRDVVTRQFGSWDPEVQETFFESKWKSQRLQKILLQDQIIGVLSVTDLEDHVFLSEILIDPSFQNRGIGTGIIRQILTSSGTTHRAIRLRVLHENKARALYERLGFVAVGETETHVLMESKA